MLYVVAMLVEQRWECGSGDVVHRVQSCLFLDDTGSSAVARVVYVIMIAELNVCMGDCDVSREVGECQRGLMRL